MRIRRFGGWAGRAYVLNSDRSTAQLRLVLARICDYDPHDDSALPFFRIRAGNASPWIRQIECIFGLAAGCRRGRLFENGVDPFAKKRLGRLQLAGMMRSKELLAIERE